MFVSESLNIYSITPKRPAFTCVRKITDTSSAVSDIEDVHSLPIQADPYGTINTTNDFLKTRTNTPANKCRSTLAVAGPVAKITSTNSAFVAVKKIPPIPGHITSECNTHDGLHKQELKERLEDKDDELTDILNPKSKQKVKVCMENVRNASISCSGTVCKQALTAPPTPTKTPKFRATPHSSLSKQKSAPALGSLTGNRSSVHLEKRFYDTNDQERWGQDFVVNSERSKDISSSFGKHLRSQPDYRIKKEFALDVSERQEDFFTAPHDFHFSEGGGVHRAPSNTQREPEAFLNPTNCHTGHSTGEKSISSQQQTSRTGVSKVVSGSKPEAAGEISKNRNVTFYFLVF